MLLILHHTAVGCAFKMQPVYAHHVTAVLGGDDPFTSHSCRAQAQWSVLTGPPLNGALWAEHFALFGFEVGPKPVTELNPCQETWIMGQA